MPRISVREDKRGGQAVYSGRTVLMRGLGAEEAQNFAAFFRAADRYQGGRSGQASAIPAGRPLSGGRSGS